jgi:formylglycine-generating enzyme required for sulfatase activity
MMRKWIVLITIGLLLSACQPIDFQEKPPVYDTGVEPEAWAFVPAGEFLQGQFNIEVNLDHEYEMMVTPVTVAQYAVYLNDALKAGTIKIAYNEIVGYYPGEPFQGGRHEEEFPAGEYIHIPLDDAFLRLDYDGSEFSASEGWENHPMTIVSWFGAQAYCAYYDWRLPTELEWEKAARGTDGRAFPWGDDLERNYANYYFNRDPFENMKTFGSRTSPVGFYNGSVYDGYITHDSASPFGIYDMAGNVWQWVGDDYDAQHYRYMRGGSKDVYEVNLRAWARNNATPTFTSQGVGFRCARDVSQE